MPVRAPPPKGYAQAFTGATQGQYACLSDRGVPDDEIFAAKDQDEIQALFVKHLTGATPKQAGTAPLVLHQTQIELPVCLPTNFPFRCTLIFWGLRVNFLQPTPFTLQLELLRARGVPAKNLPATKKEASAMIDRLREAKPPTENQKAYIERLGGNPDDAANEAAASRMIADLKDNKPVTPDQKGYLRRLGVPQKLIDEIVTCAEASELIDRRKARFQHALDRKRKAQELYDENQ